MDSTITEAKGIMMALSDKVAKRNASKRPLKKCKNGIASFHVLNELGTVHMRKAVRASLSEVSYAIKLSLV